MEKVITVSGKEHEKSNCRLIDKEYYLIGDNNIENSGDVYLINNRYIRFNTERLVFNYSLKEYQLKNDSLEYGIVEISNSSDFIFGWFTKSFDNQQLIGKDKKSYICINENVINRNFREELSTGVFYHISLRKATQFNLIKTVKKEYKESFPYDSNGIMGNYINIYENEYKPIINSTIERYSNAIGNLTFGFEFETTKGTIPKHKLSKLPLVPLRDGSIAGLEYVTIPLSGKKGIKAIIDCVGELQKRTEYDNDCSLHLHIGNIPRTTEFILAFYKLISYYQEEIFSLFPIYKKYNFGVKRKNYSQPFPINDINCKLEPSIDLRNKEQVNRNFDVLFSHLTDQNSNFYDYKCDLKNVNAHPSDPNGNQKWNIKKRYYAHNLIPLIFGNKQTIEFRIHTPTYDIDKILNFLFINSYLINYAINNQDNLLKDPYFLDRNIGKKLDKIICNYLTSVKTLSPNEKQDLMNYHLNYVNERKENVYKCNCQGNIVGKEEEIHCYQSIDWKESGTLNNYSYKTQKGAYSNNKKNDLYGLDIGGDDFISYINEDGISINSAGINFGNYIRKDLNVSRPVKKISTISNTLDYPPRRYGENNDNYFQRIRDFKNGLKSIDEKVNKSNSVQEDYDAMLERLKNHASQIFKSNYGNTKDQFEGIDPFEIPVDDIKKTVDEDIKKDYSWSVFSGDLSEPIKKNDEKKVVFEKPKSKFW